MSDASNLTPPSRRRLLVVTGLAAIAAATLFTLVVLPAEFGKDPTGFGRITGLLRLSKSGQAEGLVASVTDRTAARFSDRAYRSDVIDIPLAGMDADASGYELEYKVRMKKGDTLVYDWTAEGLGASQLYFDFHGEGPPSPKVEVVEYRQSTGAWSRGALTAPMDGVHGWYLQNQSEKPIKVRLRVSGFYELVPPGQAGNEAGISPRPTSN